MCNLTSVKWKRFQRLRVTAVVNFQTFQALDHWSEVVIIDMQCVQITPCFVILLNLSNCNGRYSFPVCYCYVLRSFFSCAQNNMINHNYNKILESDWFFARPIFYQIGARAAEVSNNKVSNNKVRVLRMRAVFIWFFVD